MFARHIAKRPPDYRQRIERVPSDGPPDRVARTIAGRIAKRIADPNVCAAALIFPGLKTLEATARVFLALGEHPGWRVTPSVLQNPVAGPMVAIALVREIPFGNGVCPSEALVLGNFPQFPPTRRAPITALEMYVGVPRQLDPKTHQPTTKANLAHLDMNYQVDGLFERVWTASMQGRLKSLGGAEDSRAKARVAFVLPVALAQKLGCTP